VVVVVGVVVVLPLLRPISAFGEICECREFTRMARVFGCLSDGLLARYNLVSWVRAEFQVFVKYASFYLKLVSSL